MKVIGDSKVIGKFQAISLETRSLLVSHGWKTEFPFITLCVLLGATYVLVFDLSYLTVALGFYRALKPIL
jgi:hypothetical protein